MHAQSCWFLVGRFRLRAPRNEVCPHCASGVVAMARAHPRPRRTEQGPQPVAGVANPTIRASSHLTAPHSVLKLISDWNRIHKSSQTFLCREIWRLRLSGPSKRARRLALDGILSPVCGVVPDADRECFERLASRESGQTLVIGGRANLASLHKCGFHSQHQKDEDISFAVFSPDTAARCTTGGSECQRPRAEQGHRR